jgi:hypothetical protein
MIDRNAGRKGKVEEAAMNNRPKKIGAGYQRDVMR